jgi:hypothetical protein
MPIEYSELTTQYIEALMREGDDFSPTEWLNKVLAERRRSESTSAPDSPKLTSRTAATPIFRCRPAAALSATTRPDTAYDDRSKNRLGRRLGELSDIWDEVQEDRRREAVYRFLEAIFALVTSHKIAHQRKRLLRRAFKFAGLPFDPDVDPFAGIIRCTTGGEVDRKTISKWSRALRFVAACKRPQTSLKRFMKKAGGINGCAARYAQRNGRTC